MMLFSTAGLNSSFHLLHAMRFPPCTQTASSPPPRWPYDLWNQSDRAMFSVGLCGRGLKGELTGEAPGGIANKINWSSVSWPPALGLRHSRQSCSRSPTR